MRPSASCARRSSSSTCCSSARTCVAHASSAAARSDARWASLPSSFSSACRCLLTWLAMRITVDCMAAALPALATALVAVARSRATTNSRRCRSSALAALRASCTRCRISLSTLRKVVRRLVPSMGPAALGVLQHARSARELRRQQLSRVRAKRVVQLVALALLLGMQPRAGRASSRGSVALRARLPAVVTVAGPQGTSGCSRGFVGGRAGGVRCRGRFDVP